MWYLRDYQRKVLPRFEFLPVIEKSNYWTPTFLLIGDEFSNEKEKKRRRRRRRRKKTLETSSHFSCPLCSSKRVTFSTTVRKECLWTTVCFLQIARKPPRKEKFSRLSLQDRFFSPLLRIGLWAAFLLFFSFPLFVPLPPSDEFTSIPALSTNSGRLETAAAIRRNDTWILLKKLFGD